MDFLRLQLRTEHGHLHVKLLDAQASVIETADPQDLQKIGLAEIHKTLAEESNPVEAIPEHGRILGNLLLPPRIREQWSKRRNQIFRTVLDLTLETAKIPWELATVGNERLFLDKDHPFLRQAKRDAAPSPVLPWPVVIIVVLGSRDEDLNKIGGYDELRNIRAVLRPRNRTIHLHVIPPGKGRSEIVSILKTHRPHILHFIGHAGDEGLSLFTGQGYTPWTKAAIWTDLNQAEFVPSLIYLNACRTLGGGQVHPDQFSNLAEIFLDKGARAVIAMHAEISGPYAAKCASTFYEETSRSSPVDVAMASARAAVDRAATENQPGLRERREAYLPVLLVSGPPDDVLPCVQDLQATLPKAHINSDSHLAKIVKELVNHNESRWAVLSSLVGKTARQNVTVVYGDSDSGKSWLLGWCIDGWLRRKFVVRYVPMAAPKNWLEVLRAILKGSKSLGAVGEPLPEALKFFEESLTAMQAPRGGRSKKISASDLNNQIPGVMETFQHALKAEAKDSPIVLVLDQFSLATQQLDPVTFNFLWESWIERFIIGGDGSIRVIIGLSDKEWKERYKLQEQGFDGITTKNFSADDYPDLLHELLQARYPEEYQQYRKKLSDEILTLAKESKSPRKLSEACDLIIAWTKFKFQPEQK